MTARRPPSPIAPSGRKVTVTCHLCKQSSRQLENQGDGWLDRHLRRKHSQLELFPAHP